MTLLCCRYGDKFTLLQQRAVVVFGKNLLAEEDADGRGDAGGSAKPSTAAGPRCDNLPKDIPLYFTHNRTSRCFLAVESDLA